MLHTLKITNIALIPDLTIHFKENLNVLTGETGAGKSIIIDSLNFLLGARADKTLIRSGEVEAKVVGVFELEKDDEKINAFFEKANIQKDDMLIITRQMNVNGKSLTQVNGEFVSANMLRELTAYLIDIHGQNEHQFLLNTKNQLQMVDRFDVNKVKALLENYKQSLQELKKVNEQIGEFGGSEEERLRQIDLLEYEVNEITEAKLSVGEEEELMARFKKLQNVEKIASQLQVATDVLENSAQGGTVGILTYAMHNLNSISQYDNEVESVLNRLDSLKIELEDVIYELNNIAEGLEFNEDEFDELDERLELIKKLKRKHGGSVEAVLEYLKITSQKLYELKHSKELLDALQKKKKEVLKTLLQNGLSLNSARKENAKALETAILQELFDLGMPNAKLEISFSRLPGLEEVEYKAHSNGLDEIEFLFSANLGEPVKPLSKIISGGEMSRLMLGVKTITAKTDEIPTMIFDEIDTGISGKMAQAVSRKLAKISREHQVIVVSHLPQIAAMADTHFFIEKVIEGAKTLTQVKQIEGQVVFNEIARMLSGELLTETSIKNAEELKESCDKYKLSL